MALPARRREILAIGAKLVKSERFCLLTVPPGRRISDQALVRASVRMQCELLDGVSVVAEATDGSQALEMVKAHHPDLVLMDITMKTMNGLDATQQIKREFPHLCVVILSSHTAEDVVRQALKAGAAGYLLKEALVPELKTAITAALRGEIYLSPRFARLATQD